MDRSGVSLGPAYRISLELSHFFLKGVGKRRDADLPKGETRLSEHARALEIRFLAVDAAAAAQGQDGRSPTIAIDRRP